MNVIELDKVKKWGFGSDKIIANKLKQLVLSGKKTATTGLYEGGKEIPKVGDLAGILDSSNKCFCIIEYTNIAVKQFLNVPYEYVIKEGEGDKDIESWRNNHRMFFKKEYADKFTENSLVICEEFRVIKIL